MQLLKTLKMLLSFHPEFKDKELFSNILCLPELYPLHLQDGHLVLWPTKTLKYSKNPDFWLLLILSVINKLLLKLLMSIFLVLLFVTLTPLLTTSMLLFLALTDPPIPSLWSIGYLPEKLKSSEDNLEKMKSGMKWSIYSTSEMLKKKPPKTRLMNLLLNKKKLKINPKKRKNNKNPLNKTNGE